MISPMTYASATSLHPPLPCGEPHSRQGQAARARALPAASGVRVTEVRRRPVLLWRCVARGVFDRVGARPGHGPAAGGRYRAARGRRKDALLRRNWWLERRTARSYLGCEDSLNQLCRPGLIMAAFTSAMVGHESGEVLARRRGSRALASCPGPPALAPTAVVGTALTANWAEPPRRSRHRTSRTGEHALSKPPQASALRHGRVLRQRQRKTGGVGGTS